MAKHYEVSAGGIVYRKRYGVTEILLLKWKNSRNKDELVIPKGKIEAGEVAKDTALREIAEETGLKESELEIIKFVTKLNYTFTAGHLKNNPTIDKDVYIFIVKYHGTSDPIVRKEERFVDYEWVNLEDIPHLSMKFDLAGIVYRNKSYLT